MPQATHDLASLRAQLLCDGGSDANKPPAVPDVDHLDGVLEDKLFGDAADGALDYLDDGFGVPGAPPAPPAKAPDVPAPAPPAASPPFPPIAAGEVAARLWASPLGTAPNVLLLVVATAAEVCDTELARLWRDDACVRIGPSLLAPGYARRSLALAMDNAHALTARPCVLRRLVVGPRGPA